MPAHDRRDEVEQTEQKPDHQAPEGAEKRATWTGGDTPLDYTATAKWIVLRKKEKPSAEIFSISYVADAAEELRRGPSRSSSTAAQASSAYLHMGAVGPARRLPGRRDAAGDAAKLVQNEGSWLAFTDLVFVDPVGTGSAA